jgi:CheY-like chemotaxis protein
VVSGVNAIERNARVQAQLIADLLDVSRVASGKLQIERQWFDPAEEIAAAVENVQPAARARDIAVDVTLEGHREPLLWDPARFQQVVWNLLDNAVKFSPDGGRVVIRLLQDETDLQLSVSDHGRGISEDFLPHVFEPFRQEHAGTKRGHGGLGLGLAIVRHLVEAHDGRITAESAGDQHGSTFTVRLPRQERQRGPAPAAPAPALPMPTLDGVRVLVVEDDFDARVLIRRMLEGAGAHVTEAADVDAAIGAIEAARPTVVVSDIALPHQDGYDLIRRIRERYRADVLPAIALTAFAREEDRSKALDAGYQAHLAKPVDPRQLLTVAASLIQGARRLTGRA